MQDDNQRLPSFIYFPGEIELETKAFEESPIGIVFRFLECFDEDGQQRFRIPPHVLKALVERFRRFTNGTVSDLNTAFGGAVARQRSNLLQQQRDIQVLWNFHDKLERIKKGDATGRGTPFEEAIEQTAKDLEMSPDNVQRIYKKYGPNSE